MKEKLEKAKKILKQYNQEHLIKYFDNLSKEKQEILLDQILNINFEQMNELYNNIGINIENTDAKIEPISFVEKNKVEEEKYFKIGSEAVKNGKLAIVTMAGGQGTRLRA